MLQSIIKFRKIILDHQRVQARLNSLICKEKKSEYIKIRIPVKYLSMIEVLAIHGITDKKQLLESLKTKEVIKLRGVELS